MFFVTNKADDKVTIENELLGSVGKSKDELTAQQKRMLEKAVNSIWREIENGMAVSFAIALHPDTHVFLDECRAEQVGKEAGLGR